MHSVSAWWSNETATLTRSPGPDVVVVTAHENAKVRRFNSTRQAHEDASRFFRAPLQPPAASGT